MCDAAPSLPHCCKHLPISPQSSPMAERRPEREPTPTVRVRCPQGRTRLLLPRTGRREHGLSPAWASPLPGTATRPEVGMFSSDRTHSPGLCPPQGAPLFRSRSCACGCSTFLPAVNPLLPEPWTRVLTQATSSPRCRAVAETEEPPQAHSSALLSCRNSQVSTNMWHILQRSARQQDLLLSPQRPWRGSVVIRGQMTDPASRGTPTKGSRATVHLRHRPQLRAQPLTPRGCSQASQYTANS